MDPHAVVREEEGEYCQAGVPAQAVFARVYREEQQNESTLVRESSMPVGSDRVFMCNSSNNTIIVLSHSVLLPTTLLKGALLCVPLPTHAERIGLERVLFSLHPSTDFISSKHKY